MADLRGFRRWFYAAALYNLVWGAIMVLFPNAFFDAVGIVRPVPIGIWQSVGMMVGVYAIGYWLLARDPRRYAALIWIGLLGKTFGPVGFLFAALRGELPWSFGFTILTNDLIWWPAFWIFGLRYAVGPVREAVSAEV